MYLYRFNRLFKPNKKKSLVKYFIYFIFRLFVLFFFVSLLRMKDDLFFNLDHGYVEGLCRGFKSGILKAAEYQNLVQCETLEGSKFFIINIQKKRSFF